MSEYPYSYARSTTVATIVERCSDLASGDSSGKVESVAGRVVAQRGHGKLAFADLRDSSGTIQLFADLGTLGADGMARFTSFRTGDVVGAEGEVIRTRRGELSLRVNSVTLLAECQRLMPEKWRGMVDVEARYRRRYLDFIANPDARRVVDARAAANAAIRAELGRRGFLEVETPLLQRQAGGALARPFITHSNAQHTDYALRIAPELYLKQLLVGGFDRVYELNRCFRNEGLSPRHLFEFTMLEAYEAYVDYHVTMTLVEDLVRAVAVAATGGTEVTVGEERVDLARPFRRITMFDAIEQFTGDDLRGAWERDDRDELVEHAIRHGVRVDGTWTSGKVLLEVFEATAERRFVEPTFVAGFPKDVSPLAKDHREIPRFTEQADLVMGGVEIAPVYSELNDPAEQRRRFEQQAVAKAAGDEEAATADEDFLEALSYGMPPAGGLGLGIDRVLMLVLGAPSLRETVAFPPLRPQAARGDAGVDAGTGEGGGTGAEDRTERG